MASRRLPGALKVNLAYPLEYFQGTLRVPSRYLHGSLRGTLRVPSVAPVGILILTKKESKKGRQKARKQEKVVP